VARAVDLQVQLTASRFDDLLLQFRDAPGDRGREILPPDFELIDGGEHVGQRRRLARAGRGGVGRRLLRRGRPRLPARRARGGERREQQ
jgi:hypothetical protein